MNSSHRTFEDFYKKLSKSFIKPVYKEMGVNEAINYLNKKGILAQVVPDATDIVVSIYHPGLAIRGYILFYENINFRCRNVDEDPAEFIPLYIHLKVSNEVYKSWTSYLVDSYDYSTQKNSVLYASHRDHMATLYFDKSIE
ncbi:hypothetical protein ACXYMU_09600 [Pontibacter sp. CAU 1760]